MAEDKEINESESRPVNEKVDERAAESLTDHNSESEKWKAELTEANDKYLRLYSEFDNYRKRTLKERIELLQTANQELMVSILPILDDFDRALKSMSMATEVQAIQEGIELIHSKFYSILTAKGLKKMESSHQKFNPDLHEAITNVPAPSENLRDCVIDEIESGYYLGEKVIRYAKVIVAN